MSEFFVELSFLGMNILWIMWINLLITCLPRLFSVYSFVKIRIF